MTYAKLQNGTLIYAPKKIKDGTTTVYNPTAEQLTAQGYKPLEIEPEPVIADGYHLNPVYTEYENRIVISWTPEQDPEPEPTLEELIEAQAEAIEELAALIAEMGG